MADYQLTATDIVIRTADGIHIPNHPENAHRVEYDEWLAAGGVPDPYVPPPEPFPVVSNRQFWHQWSVTGRLTQNDAKSMMAGTLPKVITDIIKGLNQGDQFRSEMHYLAVKFERTDDTVAQMQAAFGLAPEYMDQFFRDAALL
jgi:hypothetical protein